MKSLEEIKSHIDAVMAGIADLRGDLNKAEISAGALLGLIRAFGEAVGDVSDRAPSRAAPEKDAKPRGRKGKNREDCRRAVARLVSNDANGDAPKRRKGARVGMADVEEALRALGRADRGAIAIHIHDGGVNIPLEKLKQLVSQMLSPSRSHGRFERGDDGLYRLAGEPHVISRTQERAAAARKPRRRADGDVRLTPGQRFKLKDLVTERLLVHPKSGGRLTNEIHALFPDVDKKEVADAITEILSDDGDFKMGAGGDWALAT